MDNKVKHYQPTKLVLALVVSLFFLWSLTSNLIPVLIPLLKKVCLLTDFQSAFIDSAYWIAYFVMAIPCALLMQRYSYKTVIIMGLTIAAVGAFLFYPAALVGKYGFFLFALFLVASGMTFLETAANPYISVLGDKKTATQRINFAQAFNGLGAVVATFYLSRLIITDNTHTFDSLKSLPIAEQEVVRATLASALKMPYVSIGLVLMLFALLFLVTKMPSMDDNKAKNAFSFHFDVFNNKNYRLGVLSQFFYVGGQVCISSFFIRLATFKGMAETDATKLLGPLLLCFMIGRFVGTFLMKYLSPSLLLALFSIVNVVLLFTAVQTTGVTAVYLMFGVEFFMSIMYPTIFSLSINNLGEKTKSAASFLVMAIVGGALIPLVMGKVSDHSNIQTAYLVPMICFLPVAFFGWYNFKFSKDEE